MNDDEARRFARRMIDTWPNGPKGYVWEDAAKPLDAGHARIALRRLEATAKRAPTIAELLEQYEAARRAALADAGRQDAPLICEQCDGTGWVEVPAARAHNPDHCTPTDTRPCHCHAVEPCACSTGRRMHANAHETRAQTDHETTLFS